MDEKKVQHILMEILYSAVNEIADNESIKEKITPDILLSVCRLAEKHDLAHVVYDFVHSNEINADPKLLSRLRQAKLTSVYRCEQMKYAFKVICDTLNAAKIAYIPLKGFAIRPYYPYESMRTSCDIDILIREFDMDTAIECLKNNGYRCGDRNYHDVSLYSPNNIHLELHFSILENTDNLDAVLKDAWDYAVPSEGFRYSFSKDFFAFHFFAHMAYHFVSGGCGIRSLLDIWVLEHKMGISYLCAEELLKKAGIYRFAAEMSELAERCFTNNDIDDFSDSVLKYIFRGGVYGSKENHVAVSKSKSNSSATYAIKRLFLPYKSMAMIYPILKKAPYLLPFCWCARLIKAVFGGKSQSIISEMSCVNGVSDEKIKEIKEICSRLGL